MRLPKDIKTDDGTLADTLRLHSLWRNGEGGGKRANLRGADLSDADLSDANLRGADLSDADLRDADLRVANLRGANLRDADLRGADLRVANLRGANLRDANLRGADLSDADLRVANLSDADLRDADLSDADLSDADLSDADLRGASLWGCTGNSREIRTVQSDRWTVTYTAEVVQIGCKQYPIADWWGFDDDAIDVMDEDALDWWRTWKPILQQILHASPATPTEARTTEAARHPGDTR